MTLAIIVHGGAKTISNDKAKANIDGCTAALEAGWAILQCGASAKDAVEAAIRVLEDDPTFNASMGPTLDTEGEVYLDAAMMEGTTLSFGEEWWQFREYPIPFRWRERLWMTNPTGASLEGRRTLRH